MVSARISLQRAPSFSRTAGICINEESSGRVPPIAKTSRIATVISNFEDAKPRSFAGKDSTISLVYHTITSRKPKNRREIAVFCLEYYAPSRGWQAAGICLGRQKYRAASTRLELDHLSHCCPSLRSGP